MVERIRPSWDEYFMGIALNAAMRSSCLKLQTGTVIVKNKRVIATGYNGAPSNLKYNCLEVGCRKDKLNIKFEQKGTGTCRGTHAEMNALIYARQDLDGASLYTLIYPCSECAKHIIGAGISEVIYTFDYFGEGGLVSELFRESPISLRQLKLNPEKYDNIIKQILEQGSKK